MKKTPKETAAEEKAMTAAHLAIAQQISLHPELTYEQIARLQGVSRQTVWRVAREAHIRRTPGPKSYIDADLGKMN